MSLPEPTPKPLFKFPPFPPVPEGTTILPFASYKETGIQIAPSHSGEEVDGSGIPTVELRVPHDTDECKTGATTRSGSIMNVKKDKEEVVPVADPNPNPKRTYYHYERRDWWEEWAEAEESRGSSNAYNPNVSRMDRIHQAATDFRMNRRWPHVKSQVPYLWDQIRLYVGLLGVIPVWHRTDLASSPASAAAAQTQENTSDSDDDYSDTDTRNVYQTQQDEPQRRPFKRFHVRPPYALYGATPVQVDSDAAVQRLLEVEKGRKEERLLSFLNDPEKSVKMFLTSYMRSQGLIWSAPALNTLPRLFVFFLTFLLRNRVLPETTHERALNKALAVAKLAVEELPKTGRVCKVLPDKLGLSGVEKFGARRRALDEKKEEDDDVENTDLVEQFEAELKAANVEVLKVDDIVPSAPSPTVRPTPLPRPAKPTTTTSNETPNWAALAAADRNPTPSSTTTHSASAPNWADAPDDDDAHDNNNPFQASAKLEQWVVPTVQVDPEIARYRCGVAERSVRRVKEMKPVPVAKPTNSSLSSANDGGDLTTRYAKVVLAPWNKGEWDDGGQAPAFMKASVIPPPSSNTNDEEQHNTEEGDITILVEPHVLGSLSVGMGLAGTWVQLVPLSKGKSRKGKGGGKAERFWYVEELAMGVPSFWTVAQEEGQGVEGVCEDAYADF